MPLCLQCRTLRAVADDDGARVAVLQQRQRLEQVAVPFPASQRCDDADQRNGVRKADLTACGRTIALRKAKRVDSGRHRIDSLRVDAVVADQLFAQRIAGRYDPCGRAPIQPARRRIARHGDRHVARADQNGP